jgi:hypothetical protein
VTTASNPGPDAAARPILRVISGDATAEEIAAVLAVVTARSGRRSPAETSGDVARGWSTAGHAHRHVRATFTPSRTGWRTSFWPR